MGRTPIILSWCTSKDTGIVMNNPPAKVSRLSINLDDLIKSSSEIVYSYGEHYDKNFKVNQSYDVMMYKFKQNIVDRIANLVTLFKPLDTLLLSMGGVIPMAGINNIRTQLYKEKYADNHRKKINVNRFDVSLLCPGTHLMRSVTEFIQTWISESAHSLPGEVILFSHLTPGSSIDKILHSVPINPKGSHIIKSSCSESIIRAILSTSNNTVISREFVTRKRRKIQISTKYVSINNLRSLIHRSLSKRKTSLYDFSILLSMLGNKYLPKCPSLDDSKLNNTIKGIDDLILSYNNANVSLVDVKNGNIKWDSLLILLGKLKDKEEAMLSSQLKNRDKENSSSKISSMSVLVQSKNTTQTFSENRKLVDYNKYRNNWYSNAIGPRSNTQSLGILNGMSVVYDGGIYGARREDVIAMCINYLNGIQWSIDYHSLGISGVSNEWVYPKHYAPLFVDMYSVLRDVKVINEIYPKSKEAINTLHMLIMVLPMSSFSLLPVVIENKLKEISELSYNLPVSYILDVNNGEEIHLIPKHKLREVISFMGSDDIIRVSDDFSIFNSENKEIFVGPVKNGYYSTLNKNIIFKSKTNEKIKEDRDIDRQVKNFKNRRDSKTKKVKVKAYIPMTYRDINSSNTKSNISRFDMESIDVPEF
ncbi:MAG: hypothetical protein COA94_08380 [Rickettsiales bacterium]|nr:MAG: hypothetical protein COA94_08380 [Rickettsiales bacterium]